MQRIDCVELFTMRCHLFKLHAGTAQTERTIDNNRDTLSQMFFLESMCLAGVSRRYNFSPRVCTWLRSNVLKCHQPMSL